MVLGIMLANTLNFDKIKIYDTTVKDIAPDYYNCIR